MNLSPLRCTLPVVAVLTAGFAGVDLAAQQVTLSDELFPGAVEGDRGPAVTRLVDDLSGAPIAGAAVFLVAESKHPIAGEFWFSHRGVSDADGFVRIPRPNGNRDWHWQVMKHPTLGTAARSSYVEPIWRIGRPFDVPLEIQDWAGRPAAGARIGFCGGCGHSPDLATATADANGFAVLRGIDPQQDISDLYVQHPGLHFFYQSVRWRPGEPPMVVQCADGPAQTGRVVDHLGQAVAGAFVCGGSRHRGPWARTAADGSFTVLGGERSDSPHQVVTADGREVHFDVKAADSYPVTLHLPDLTAPGFYEGTAEVTAREAAAVVTRPVRVVVENAPAAGVRLSVEYRGRAGDTGDVDGRVEVPLAAPFVLSVSEDRERGAPDQEFAFADGATVADPLVVRWLPSPRIVGRVVDAAGLPVASRVDWRYTSEDDSEVPATATSEFDLSADDGRGWHLLEVAAANGAPARLLWVMVPGPGGRVDLGDLVVGGAPQLRVHDGDGGPLPAAIASLLRPGWQEAGQSRSWPLAADGAFCGPDLREGDTIVVRRDADAVPFRTVLQGEGPWQIAPPAGAIDLEVVDAAGAPRPCTVVIGDHYVAADQGNVALRGLPTGALRLYVSAPGCRSAIVDAAVTPAGSRQKVVLPAR